MSRKFNFNWLGLIWLDGFGLTFTSAQTLFSLFTHSPFSYRIPTIKSIHILAIGIRIRTEYGPKYRIYHLISCHRRHHQHRRMYVSCSSKLAATKPVANCFACDARFFRNSSLLLHSVLHEISFQILHDFKYSLISFVVSCLRTQTMICLTGFVHLFRPSYKRKESRRPTSPSS